MNSLLPREWIAIFLIISFAFLLLFLGIHKNNDLKGESFPEIQNQFVVIKIEGAVQKPGKYHVLEGIKVKEAIQKAYPLPDSDLERFKHDQIIKKGMKIKVSRKKGI